MATEAKTSVGRVVWHELVTTDVKAAQAFYEALLAWKFEIWKPGEMDYPMISVNGQTHGGIHPAEGGAPSHWIGHIQVEDSDTAAEKARSLGATVLAGPMDIPEVGRFTVISDPAGAVCSLYRPAGEGPMAEGVFAWDELLVDDVAAATRFYGEVVGWTTSEMDMGPMGTYTIFQTREGIQVGGCMRKPDMMPQSAWLTYLVAEDVDDAVARTKSLDGTVVQEPLDIADVGRIAVIMDSTGAAVGLLQPAGS